MRLPAILLGLTVALGATSAGANEPLTYDQAVSRLRACATAGATNAPYGSLREAVIVVRSLCRPQIDRVYDMSDARIGAGNPHASVDRLGDLRVKARRKIDRDLVVLVSTQTGLVP